MVCRSVLSSFPISPLLRTVCVHILLKLWEGRQEGRESIEIQRHRNSDRVRLDAHIQTPDLEATSRCCRIRGGKKKKANKTSPRFIPPPYSHCARKEQNQNYINDILPLKSKNIREGGKRRKKKPPPESPSIEGTKRNEKLTID